MKLKYYLTFAAIAATFLLTQSSGISEERVSNERSGSSSRNGQRTPSPSDILIVQLQDGADQQRFDEELKAIHGTVLGTIPAGPDLSFLIVQTEPGQADAVQKKLSQSKDVESVERNRACSPQTSPPARMKRHKKRHKHFGVAPPPNQLGGIPNDPYLPDQWPISAMHYTEARDSGLSYQTPITVYYVDSGANVIPGEVNTSAIQFDFSNPVKPTGAEESVHDANYHGTATTTLICTTDNALGYTGIANMEGNYCYLFMCRANQDGFEFGNYVGIIAALGFITNTKGLPPGPICLGYNDTAPDTFNSDPLIQNLALRLRKKGFVLVLPAGNDGQVDPSPEKHIRRVASIDPDGQLSSFSNYGPFPAVAPGGNIEVYTVEGGIQEGWIANGTSMAAPAWCAAIADVIPIPGHFAARSKRCPVS